MANAGFYNENEYRQYPFIDKPEKRAVLAVELPTELIVDCGFILGIDSKFDAKTDYVYLKRLVVQANSYSFVFKTTAATALNTELIFHRLKTDENWLTEHKSSVVADISCATEPIWEGFIVTGNLQLDTPPPIGTYDFALNDYEVEPAQLQSLVRSYLRSVSVGNYSRTVIPECANNSSSSQNPAAQRSIITQANCLKGGIQFSGGINCNVEQNDITNTIRISPVRGANLNTPVATELCENHGELPLFTNEPKAQGSQFLSGGPACNELISSINGIGGPNVIINGGPGILVNNADNKITLNVSDTVIAREC